MGCHGQARKRCSNRWCCGPRNYASDVRPTDPLAAGVESPSQTLAPGVVFCTATTAGLKYLKKQQPSGRGGSSLVRHVKCLTSLYMIFDVGKYFARQKSSLLTVKFYFTYDTFSHLTLFHFISCPRRTALKSCVIRCSSSALYIQPNDILYVSFCVSIFKLVQQIEDKIFFHVCFAQNRKQRRQGRTQLDLAVEAFRCTVSVCWHSGLSRTQRRRKYQYTI